MLALVIGGAAGVLDRSHDTADAGESVADSPTTTGASTTPSPTTVPPATAAPTTTATTAPVEVPSIGAVDPGIVALGGRVAAIEGLTPADIDDLVRDLTDGSGSSTKDDDTDLMALAAARVRDDFTRRDTIEVDGWILSASEARAAAVIALLCTDPTGAAC